MTPLKQVRKLHPGERLVVENGVAPARALVDLPGARPPTPSERSSEEWAEIVLGASSTTPCGCA